MFPWEDPAALEETFASEFERLGIGAVSPADAAARVFSEGQAFAEENLQWLVGQVPGLSIKGLQAAQQRGTIRGAAPDVYAQQTAAVGLQPGAEGMGGFEPYRLDRFGLDLPILTRQAAEAGFLGEQRGPGMGLEGLTPETYFRLSDIQQGAGRPDDPYATNLGLSGRELAPDISFRVEEGRIRSVLTRALNLNRILSQMSQTTRGQYQSEIAAKAKMFVIRNYNNRQRNTSDSTSGTLGAALQEITPKVSIDPRTGMAIDMELPERSRPARENEPGGVSVRKYGPIVFQGRPGIVPGNQRYLRFKLNGQWITTRNVAQAMARPVNPMHFPKQREELAQMFGQMVYQGLKKHIGAAVESEQRNEGMGVR